MLYFLVVLGMRSVTPLMYVDDILEKVKTGHTQSLTDHFNTMDITGNVKFTHEEEMEQTIAFLAI